MVLSNHLPSATSEGQLINVDWLWAASKPSEHIPLAIDELLTILSSWHLSTTSLGGLFSSWGKQGLAACARRMDEGIGVDTGSICAVLGLCGSVPSFFLCILIMVLWICYSSPSLEKERARGCLTAGPTSMPEHSSEHPISSVEGFSLNRSNDSSLEAHKGVSDLGWVVLLAICCVLMTFGVCQSKTPRRTEKTLP